MAQSKKKTKKAATPKKKTATKKVGAKKKSAPKKKAAVAKKTPAKPPAAVAKATPKTGPMSKPVPLAKPAAPASAPKPKPVAQAKPPTPKPATPSAAPGMRSGAGITAADVNLGHIAGLKPRTHTGFKPEAFQEAKRALADARYSTIEEAARAVAEKATELSNDSGPLPFSPT